MNHPMKRAIAGQAVLVAGILLIAAALRAPFTGLPPLLGPIAEDFGLNTLATGALTTLPLLAFALISPFGALFARAFGLERTLFYALAAIALGIALRSADGVWTLYLGTAIIGMGIACGNVLLPSLVKRDFPQRIASLTGAYALTMGVAAAVGSAVVIPLAQAWGWRVSLGTFLLLPMAALAVWMTQLGVRASQANAGTTAPQQDGGKVWHSVLAWQVTLFFGLNSTIYYIVIGWLPAILVDAGMTPARAGSLHGILQLASAVPGLVIGPILGRMRDQRLAAAVVSLFSATALLGLLLAPQLALAWSILFGLGSGANIILGLSFIALRTSNAHQAATLSGMSQCLGYLLAATGPIAIGALHDFTGGWQAPLALCTALALAAMGMGILSGRNRRIGA